MSCLNLSRGARLKIETAFHRPGEVVVANCGHPLEDPKSVGKPRPMVLWRREGGHWWAMGLTTNPQYRNGCPRTPIPNPAALGLGGPGFLWGSLTRIPVIDVFDHLGWITHEVHELIDHQVED